mmetsp:Transcript_7326/g.16020  ORF Transcript_7326/g.16020 Transcript_7326/m.16020 type:complete len:215 (-) Transcript_7326:13-657(-)
MQLGDAVYVHEAQDETLGAATEMRRNSHHVIVNADGRYARMVEARPLPRKVGLMCHRRKNPCQGRHDVVCQDPLARQKAELIPLLLMVAVRLIPLRRLDLLRTSVATGTCACRASLLHEVFCIGTRRQTSLANCLIRITLRAEGEGTGVIRSWGRCSSSVSYRIISFHPAVNVVRRLTIEALHRIRHRIVNIFYRDPRCHCARRELGRPLAEGA